MVSVFNWHFQHQRVNLGSAEEGFIVTVVGSNRNRGIKPLCYLEGSSLRAKFKDSDLKDEFKALIPNKNRIKHPGYWWGPQSLRSIDGGLKSWIMLLFPTYFENKKARWEMVGTRQDGKYHSCLGFPNSNVDESHYDIPLPGHTSVLFQFSIK